MSLDSSIAARAAAMVLVLVVSGCATLDRGQSTATEAPATRAAIEAVLDAVDADLASGNPDAAMERLAAARDAYPDSMDLAATYAGVASDAGDREAALEGYGAAAALAARHGDTESAGLYNEIITELARAWPDWVEERLARAGGLTEEQAVEDSYARWDELLASAHLALEDGDLEAAVEDGEAALDVAEASFGPNHLLTINSLRELAEIKYVAGDMLNAESLLNVAAERAADALGENHPETVAINGTVAALYEDQGRLEDALFLREINAEALTEALGPNHPDTLSENRARARLMGDLGRFEDAADLLDATCAGLETTLGRYHPSSAECLTQLGQLLESAGETDAARQVFSEALQIDSAVLGATDPVVLLLRSDLAELMRRDAQFDAALAELEDLLATARTMYPDDVDLKAKIASTLARVHEDMGNFKAALALKQEVYADRVERLGEDDPDTLAALSALGDVFLRMGQFGEAEDAYELALAGYLDIYGENHAATVAVMNNLGLTLEQAGLYDRAEPLLRQALTISQALLGPAHPTTLRNMNNLALLYESQGNFDRAEPLYRGPIEILTQDLGEDHPDTLAMVNNLAYLYMLEQDYPAAAEMFERVYQGWSRTLGPDNQNTLKGENNLARVYLALGRLDDAEVMFEDALARRRGSLGDRHIDVQRSMHDLADLYLAQGRLDEAEALLRDTLALNEAELGAQHPYTFETLGTLAEVLQAQGRLDDSIDVRSDIFERRTRFLDRMLWATSENAREGYIRLHRPELDAYVRASTELNSVDGGLALLNVALQRKGLLLRISAEIQQIANLGLNAELADLADQLTAKRKELAALTLAGPQDLTGDEHLSEIRALESEVEVLEGQLARESAVFRETSAAVDINDLLEQMPENAVLIDWLVYNDADGTPQLAAGILARTAGEPVLGRVLYDDYAAVRSAISEYRELVQDQGAPDEEIVEIGQWIYEQIWKPVAEYIPDGARVYIVPDGALNIVPFEALVDADERFLLETTELVQLSTSRDLVPSTIPAAQGPVMVMAGPDYDTEDAAGPEVLAEVRSRAATRATRSAQRAAEVQAGEPQVGELVAAGSRGLRSTRAARLRSLSPDEIDSRSAAAKATLRAASAGLRGLRFSPLPGAEREGQLIIEEVLDSGLANDMYAGKRAEERVLADLEQPPRVLHVATHGFFLKSNDELRKRLLKLQRSADVALPPPGDNPLLRAGLAFAGINSNAPYLGEIDTENDGVLTALEVLSLNLAGTELAVLSACETGLGEVHDGEGVYGLRRAFEEAGVKQIVMSLWEVSDAGTQALMTLMYANLLSGMEPREALRSAQRELMQDPRWGYPYIWAAFTIVGN